MVNRTGLDGRIGKRDEFTHGLYKAARPALWLRISPSNTGLEMALEVLLDQDRCAYENCRIGPVNLRCYCTSCRDRYLTIFVRSPPRIRTTHRSDTHADSNTSHASSSLTRTSHHHTTQTRNGLTVVSGGPQDKRRTGNIRVLQYIPSATALSHPLSWHVCSRQKMDPRILSLEQLFAPHVESGQHSVRGLAMIILWEEIHTQLAT